MFWVWQKLLFVFGGLMLPIRLYPPIMQRLAALTPFPDILAGPASFVLDGEAVAADVLFVRLAVWCVATTAIVRWMYAARATRVDREWWVRRYMRPRRNSIRFAAALLATNLKASLMLRGAFAMQVIFMALNNLTFFVFWWVLMRRVPDIRGWRLTDIELLFGIVAVAVGLTITVAGGVRYLGQFIEEGELDTLLVQPPPVLLYAVGMRSQSAGFGDIVSGLILIALSGHVTWIDTPRVVVATVAAALVFAASGILFFSVAFWLGKSDTVARQMWELVSRSRSIPSRCSAVCSASCCLP